MHHYPSKSMREFFIGYPKYTIANLFKDMGVNRRYGKLLKNLFQGIKFVTSDYFYTYRANISNSIRGKRAILPDIRDNFNTEIEIVLDNIGNLPLDIGNIDKICHNFYTSIPETLVVGDVENLRLLFARDIATICKQQMILAKNPHRSNEERDRAKNTALYFILLFFFNNGECPAADSNAYKKIQELKDNEEKKREITLIPYRDIHIERIINGAPFYRETDHTLRTQLSELSFYLAPPWEELTPEQQDFLRQHHFSERDQVLDISLEEAVFSLEFPDVLTLIEDSRRKIVNDFLYGTNGCYFNNKKFGIHRIEPYGRTEDITESPILTITFYTTDYYTHRVMKDVCKKIFAKDPSFFHKHIDFLNLYPYRILFTSLGINLLLLDMQIGEIQNALLTCRATSASETYGKVQYSLSVIEGVSYSDYDPYERKVYLSTALKRGLREELGVESDMLRYDSLKYYDLFVNMTNLEIGISCSIELERGLSLQDHVLLLHGKDEVLEVAERFVNPIMKLREFVCRHQNEFLPQAVYAIGSYMESIGIPILCHETKLVLLEEEFIKGKHVDSPLCGDTIYKGEHYIAIIDGNTPKTDRRWKGKPSDVFVADWLKNQMSIMPPGLEAEEVIQRLNLSLLKCYRDGEFEGLPPEERLSAVVLIYSHSKQEIWGFGDCQFRINGVSYHYPKEIDIVLSNVRSFFIETELISGKTIEDIQKKDTGREFILPLLKRQMSLANLDCPFGYDVLDGSKIHLHHIRKRKVKSGDYVVLASDGYPNLCDTLEESERLLAEALDHDPLCIHENRGTKALNKGDISYDDRCFVSFIVR